MKAVNVNDALKILYEYGAFVFVTDSKRYSEMVNKISNLPELKPRTGHWVEIGDEPYDTWECDNCGFVIDGSGCVDPDEYRDIYKFCPNCGAKMEG